MSSAWERMLQWEAANGIERGPEHHADAEPPARDGIRCDLAVADELPQMYR